LSPSTDLIAALVADVERAPDELTRGTAFRRGFDQLRSQWPMHPSERTPAATFEAAARTTRQVSAQCLPLGIALVMHLYPLCTVRHAPLPWWSPTGFRRSRLLHDIDQRSLILANAGSERAAGAHAPVTLTRMHDGIHVEGSYDYVSLAHVADLVLFSAPLAGGTGKVFCVATMRGESVRIGCPRFGGSMQLSDTCAVSFNSHRVPPGYFLVVPDNAYTCMAHYQRSWFHLLLGEAYQARIEHLQSEWNLPRSVEEIAAANELALMQAYALRLLDDIAHRAAATNAMERLSRLSAALKLRISWQAQSTAEALRPHDDTAAQELCYLRRQPPCDDQILCGFLAAHNCPAGALERGMARENAVTENATFESFRAC
jgi:alkylation response protein AidB-like acyl-CoA dehydrogenase